MTIITRHLIVSFLAPFVIGQFFFSMVIMLFSMRQVVTAIIEKGIHISMLFQLTSYSMGWTFGMTVPMSALLAVILTIGTLNSDQEIIAMRASGIHYLRIFRPYFLFGVFMTIFLLWYQMNVVPYCIKMMSYTGAKIANYNPTALIEEGRFIELDKNNNQSRTIFVNKMEEDEITHRTILKGIQIRKVVQNGTISKLTEVVFAKSGEKISKKMKNGRIQRALRLYDGFVYIPGGNNDDTFEKLNFEGDGYMDVNIKDNIMNVERIQTSSLIEYSYKQIIQAMNSFKNKNLKDPKVLHEKQMVDTEFNKRLSLPFATLFFMLAGFPLGIVNRRSGKGVGFGQAIIIIFIYFSLYLASDALVAQNGFFTPFKATWFGNLIIAIIGTVFFVIKTTDIGWKLKKIN